MPGRWHPADGIPGDFTDNSGVGALDSFAHKFSHDFFVNPALRPNMIRFQIIYDTTQPAFAALLAVTELTINVLPD